MIKKAGKEDDAELGSPELRQGLAGRHGPGK